MIGYIAYREDVKTWAVEEKNLLGLRFLRLTLPKGRRVLGKHYAGRAARAMGKLGCARRYSQQTSPGRSFLPGEGCCRWTPCRSTAGWRRRL